MALPLFEIICCVLSYPDPLPVGEPCDCWYSTHACLHAARMDSLRSFNIACCTSGWSVNLPNCVIAIVPPSQKMIPRRLSRRIVRDIEAANTLRL